MKVTKNKRIYCEQGPDFLPATAAGSLAQTSFVFKDLFDVQGYVTGAGNPAWLESHQPAKHSSPLIDKLLGQGASCVSRVQTDELAYSLNGQNIHYGTPINPVAPNCLPGGSSSGSAVAVAKGEADFSIGTDTGGSVRVPASYCGLFGLRPTLGKLSLEHTFELSRSFDTAGIFTRDLTLLKQVFSVLSGDSVEAASAKQVYLDKTLAKSLSVERLNRLHDCCKQAGITLLVSDILAEQGKSLADLSLLFRTIQGFEIIKQHHAWLKNHGHTLDPAIIERVAWARTISYEQYQDAKVQQVLFQERIAHSFKGLSGLWILPTTPSGPPSLTLPGESLAEYRTQLMGLTSVAGLTGFPQLHMPMPGLAEGPCGFSLMGCKNSEAELFATGLALSLEAK